MKILNFKQKSLGFCIHGLETRQSVLPYPSLSKWRCSFCIERKQFFPSLIWRSKCYGYYFCFASARHLPIFPVSKNQGFGGRPLSGRTHTHRTTETHVCFSRLHSAPTPWFPISNFLFFPFHLTSKTTFPGVGKRKPCMILAGASRTLQIFQGQKVESVFECKASIKMGFFLFRARLSSHWSYCQGVDWKNDLS